MPDFPLLRSRACAPVLLLSLCLAFASNAVVTTASADTASTRPAVGAKPSKPVAASVRLHRLFEDTWERDLKASPLTASYYGDIRYNDRLPDASIPAYAREHQADRAALKTLLAINRAALAAPDQLNYDLFKRLLEQRISEYAFKPWAYAMTTLDGPQNLNTAAEVMPFATVADYEQWLKRMRAVPTYLKQTEETMRAMAAEGRTQPRSIMQRALEPLERQASAAVDEHPFFERFKRNMSNIPAAEQARLVQEARKVIANDVVPAYQRFARFFREDYLPKCRESVGIADTPDGRAYYANRAQFHTTTVLTPDEIHAIGLKEVARIHTEMQAVMDRLEYKGTRAAFFEYLRTDPKFYFTDADDLFRAYVYTTKMIEPELPKLFGRLYRSPVGVKPIPASIAPNTTTAYYNGPSQDGRRPGYFFANLYRPEVRPKYEIEVLTAHEAIPGHHLQIALATEQSDLPKFRRFSYITAYAEGWALYSERLGFELGLYKNAYSHFGMLTYDMWRAVRLVVDTGLHVKGWSRQQAIDYFKANAPKTEADIINEIDRYIGWPGQALAYKVGQLKILELRAEAEAALKEKFDIRAFHDALLETGALPLDVLEKRMDTWVSAAKRPTANP